jgi:hypothetical protein
MENGLIEHRMQTQANQRLPWHKPEVQRLVVSIDTREPEKLGSAEDGAVFNRVVGGSPD